MDRAYDTYVEKELQTNCWCIKPKEGDHVHCLSVVESTIFKTGVRDVGGRPRQSGPG